MKERRYKKCWRCGYIILRNSDAQSMWISKDETNTEHIKVFLHNSCFKEWEDSL